jgi:catechol 2,3 dioxygenase
MSAPETAVGHRRERVRDIAHIGPIELVVPEFEASIRFYVEQLGLTEVERRGGHSYLHTWDDYGAITLMLFEGRHPGVRRTFLRVAGPNALQRRVAAIEAAGLGEGWSDQITGQGPTYLFHDPDGHRMGIYWERDWYQPADADRPSLKNQAARFPGRGANIRRLDHINYLSAHVLEDCAFYEDVLGAVRTEQIIDDEGVPQAVWFTYSDKTYDMVANIDHTGSSGRLHHIAFAADTREDILRAADVCLEAGIHIETGPHKHAIQQTFFLYVWDPSGNRIELANAGARLLLAPDWQTISWTAAERARGQAWGLKTIESFHTHGTPAPGEVAG